MVLNELGSLASISGLGVALREWFRTREHQADADDGKVTIAEFREWLNWKNQEEILQQLESSGELLPKVIQLLEALASQSEDQRDGILERLEELDLARGGGDRNIRVGRDVYGGSLVSGDRNLVINLFPPPADLSADDQRFEAEYLQRVRKEYERLRVLGVSEMRQIRQKLSIAYVSLNMKRLVDAGQREPLDDDEPPDDIESRRAEEVLLEEPLLAIRGPAGSGKTTLLNWLALRCASEDEEGENAWQGGIPFFVPLRRLDDSNEGRPDPESFTTYTIDPKVWEAQPPTGWLNRVLDQKRAVLLLDGVDELPQAIRPKFWDWLDKFAEQFPGNRIYVSSRPFPEQKREKLWNPPPEFASTDLDEMSDQDVREFINNWHNAVIVQEKDEYERHDLETRRDRLPERLAEPRNRSVRELCRTPLLSALVCAVHWREEGYLPDSRIELYDNCCRMLLELRDIKRDVKREPGPLGALTLDDKEMILRRLALKMMLEHSGTKSKHQVEIARDIADQWVALSMPSCASDQARQCQPSDVIDLLIERSGLLREPAKDRIDFPHRTFQEYLAACAAGEDNVPADLAARADDDQWRETILLAAGTKVGGVPYGNALIERLVKLGEREKANKYKRHACFALAVGCLETGRANVKQDVRDRVLGHLKEITPPRTFEEARILSAGGEVVLDYLQFSRWTRKEDKSVEVTAACARTLALIGSERAVAMLVEPKGYGGDDRATVQIEICKCPNLDPMQVPAICKSFGRESGPDVSVKPLIVRITPGTADHLQTVERLNLRGCSGLTELSLPELANLSSLGVYGCSRLTELSLPELANLSSLNLSRCSDLTELLLPELANLRSLDLSYCSGLTVLSLPELANLSSLDLSYCSGLTELSLPELVNLSSLDLRHCSGLTELSLPELVNLSSLDLRHCSGLTELSLPELANLSELHLSHCRGLTALSLPELANLSELHLSGCIGLTALSLPNLANLSSLSLSGCAGLRALSLSKLPKLRALYLDGCTSLAEDSVQNLPESCHVSW